MGVSSDDAAAVTDEVGPMDNVIFPRAARRIAGDTMRTALGRIVLWVAEKFDDSLLTVPDLDFDEAYSRSPIALRSSHVSV
jgi:hypothetical protein